MVTPPHIRHLGPRPLPVSPLEGVKKFFSNAIFSETATDIVAVLSPLCTPLGSPFSAPTSLGLGPPPLWGSDPQPKILGHVTLRFFEGRCGRMNFSMCTSMGVLSRLKIAKGFDVQFLRKWGSKFWGACHFGGSPYIRNLFTAFCRGAWAVKSDVEILWKSASGLEL